MADSTPAVQTELTVALAALGPQLKGLQDLAAGASGALAATLASEAEVQIERQALMQAALAAIAALQADGYPTLPPVNALRPSLVSELQEKQAAIASAIGLFTNQT